MAYSMTMWQFDYPTHYFWDWWLMRKHFHGNLRYLNYRSCLYRSFSIIHRSFAIIRDNMEFWVNMWDFGCTTLIFVTNIVADALSRLETKPSNESIAEDKNFVHWKALLWKRYVPHTKISMVHPKSVHPNFHVITYYSKWSVQIVSAVQISQVFVEMFCH